MIIARITDGLGNQLFQYAAGRALAGRRGVPLLLDTRWFHAARRAPHERFGLAPYLGPHVEASAWDLCWVRGRPRTWDERGRVAVQRLVDKVRRGGRARRIRYARDGDFSFDPGFFDLPDETYLDGNWQSESYFGPAAEDVRRLLHRYRPAAPVRLLGEVMAAEPSAFVHVRRGDYVDHAHFSREIGALPAGYYTRALAALRQTVGPCRVFVFTNDEAWVRDQLALPEAQMVPSTIASAPQDILHLMSRCRHAIIANSSLSWWGAWLGAHANQFVAAPTPWFADSWRNTRDLLPHWWCQIPRSP